MPGPLDVGMNMGAGMLPQQSQAGQPQALPLIKYLMETLNIGQESAMKLAARLGPGFSPSAASSQVSASPIMNQMAFGAQGATGAGAIGVPDAIQQAHMMAPQHDDTLRLEQLKAMANYPGGGASRTRTSEPGVIDSTPTVSQFPSFTVQSDGHSTDNEQPMFPTPKDYAAADYIGPNTAKPRPKTKPPAKVTKVESSDMPVKKTTDSD